MMFFFFFITGLGICITGGWLSLRHHDGCYDIP
jgi:hypothetical protein